MDSPINGLTEAEARRRKEIGQGNAVQFATGRTYLQILRKNTFTFINSILFAISVALILMGRSSDAVVTAGLVLFNVVIGVFQEARAKRKLERIALLVRPQARVLRDGQEKIVDPGDVVLGDAVVARSGDQIVADGQVVGQGGMEVDESLLTGESERVPKGPGDPVYSGTFCVAGSAIYEAQKVGAQSGINQLTAGARQFRSRKTPMQREIDWLIRILSVTVGLLSLFFALSFFIGHTPLVEGLRQAAVLVALVPQGLLLMTTVAYAMGALRVAGRGALIQETNSIEGIGHVSLLCLDKTGTLTTNRIRLDGLNVSPGAAAADEGRLRQVLGDYAASTSGENRTTAAMLEAFGGRARPLAEEVPFSSERKWSALTFGDVPLASTYVLGAPEILSPAMKLEPGLGTYADRWARQGLRVLLFTCSPERAAIHDEGGHPRLPEELVPLCLLSFREELRPEARSTLQHFGELDIGFKIISGDHPDTVVALLKQLGFEEEIRSVSGLDLAKADPAQRMSRLEESTVLGRVTPQQKEELVGLLQQQGKYVAMIGDGVNDMLSLKQANVGVAMQSGSQATRSVADIVLMGDSFAALPQAFREGQRILRGMTDVIRLLVTRTLYVLLVVVACKLVGVAFPITPKNNAVLALLTAGIPILAIAAWAKAGSTPSSLMRSAAHFILPASVSVAFVSTLLYVGYLGMGAQVAVARSVLTTFMVLCGAILILFVEPPTEWWVGGDVLSGDWRPTVLAAGMLVLYGIIVAVPAFRAYFELTVLRPVDYLLIAGVGAVWTIVSRFAWRTRLFERLVKI